MKDMLPFFLYITGLCAATAHAASQVPLASGDSPSNSCASNPSWEACCPTPTTSGTICVDGENYDYTCGQWKSYQTGINDISGKQCIEKCNQITDCVAASWNGNNAHCYLSYGNGTPGAFQGYLLFRKSGPGECGTSDDTKNCQERIDQAVEQCTDDCAQNLRQQKEDDKKTCDDEKTTLQKELDEVKTQLKNSKSRHSQWIDDPTTEVNQAIVKIVQEQGWDNVCRGGQLNRETFTTINPPDGTWNEWEIVCNYLCTRDSVKESGKKCSKDRSLMDNLKEDQENPNYFGFAWTSDLSCMPLYATPKYLWPQCTPYIDNDKATRYHLIRRTKAFA